LIGGLQRVNAKRYVCMKLECRLLTPKQSQAAVVSSAEKGIQL
jgi:hypothetical protein